MRGSKTILLCHRSLYSTHTTGRSLSAISTFFQCYPLHPSVSCKSRLLSSASTYSIIKIVLLLPPKSFCGYKCHRKKMCCSSIWRKETSLISRSLLCLAHMVFEEWPVTHYMCTAFSMGGCPTGGLGVVLQYKC